MSPAAEATAREASPAPEGLSAGEMIVDLFAGGGGASTAILMATGRHPDVAVNHDPEAVALHSVNHPATRHYCCDVFEVDPVEACRDAHGNLRPVGLLWASPDCTHHSKARGGKPADKKIRALAWVVVKWAAELKRASGRGPRCIFLENVEEFQDWGPLGPDNRPIKERKGEIFRLWVSQLEALGYAVDWRELVAADYGAPTTRKRLFLIARNDGRPITWPKPTHAPRGKVSNPGLFDEPLRPWRAAAEIIDWTLPCPSIFDRKKALAPKTQKRIAKGVRRFVIEAKSPFIVPVINGTWNPDRSWSAQDPLRTVTASKGGDYALVDPVLAGGGVAPVTHAGERPVHDLDDPLRTVTSANRGELGLIGATLTPRYGEAPGQEPRARDIAEPYPAVVPKGNGGDLTAAHLVRFMGDSAGRDAGEPAPTVTANSFVKRPGGASPMGVATAVLTGVAYGDDRERAGLRAWSPEDPVGTVTASNDKAVACASLLRTDMHKSNAGCFYDPEDPLRTATSAGGHGLAVAHVTKFSENSTGTDPGDPLHTAMAGAPRHGLVTAYLGRQFGTTVSGRDLDDPHPTVVTDGGGGKSQVVAAHLARQFGRSVGSDAADPVGVVTPGGGGKTQVVAPVLDKYYATGVPSDVAEPLDTTTTKARFGLSSAYLEQANTGMVGHDARDPVSTIVGKGCTQRPVQVELEALEGAPGSRRRQVLAFLWEHFGEPSDAERADPLATAQGRLRYGLVILDGAVWQIADIGMRMLVPRELYGAQGFPDDYVIDRVADGQGGFKPLTKTAQTRMAGNSVSPPPAAAMIAANDPLLEQERAAA